MKLYLAENHKKKLLNNINNIYNKNNHNIVEQEYILIISKKGIYYLDNDLYELVIVDKDTFKINNFCNEMVIYDESYFKKIGKNSNIPLDYKTIKVHKYIYNKYITNKVDGKFIKKKLSLVLETNEVNSKLNTIFYIEMQNINIKDQDDFNLLSNFVNNLF